MPPLPPSPPRLFLSLGNRTVIPESEDIIQHFTGRHLEGRGKNGVRVTTEICVSSYPHQHSHVCVHFHTHTHTLSHSHTHTHTLTHTLSLSHTHTHSHTHTLSLSLSLGFSFSCGPHAVSPLISCTCVSSLMGLSGKQPASKRS